MAKTQNTKTAAAKPGKNKKFKKRERKNVPFGLVFIQASFNNTIVTITDQTGNTLSWKSSGSLGFPAYRKGTPPPRPRGASARGDGAAPPAACRPTAAAYKLWQPVFCLWLKARC